MFGSAGTAGFSADVLMLTDVSLPASVDSEAVPVVEFTVSFPTSNAEDERAGGDDGGRESEMDDGTMICSSIMEFSDSRIV